MHIRLKRNDLLEVLQSVIGVVDRRQTLPILSNVLFEVKDDQLRAVGTDLELQLEATTTVQNLSPGSAAVPARKAFDICKALPEGSEIDCQDSGGRMTIKAGRSRFVLSTMSGQEFPSFPMADPDLAVVLPAKSLKHLLHKTLFAMAQQDVRYYLNGLLLEFSAHRVRAVATDGHRLALSEFAFDTGVEKPRQWILPRKAVLELQRLVDQGEQVALELSASQIAGRFENVRLSSKVIDGRFPDYERVIPDSPERIVTADRERVKAALSRVAILSNEKFRGVRLLLSEGTLSIQSQNPDQEEAEEEVDVNYSGEPLEIGFNVVYLLDALNAMDSTEFVLELRGSDGSGLLRDASGGSSRYVVMPMRL